MSWRGWLIFLSAMGCAHGSLAQIDSRKLSDDLDEGRFQSLADVRAIDVEKVGPVIRGYVVDKGPSIPEPALEAIRRIPNLAQWVSQDIDERIAVGRLDFTVHEDFQLLGRLRTPEGVREIGRYINNETVLKSPSDDLANDKVSVNAALALSLGGFENAPTANLWDLGGLGRADIKLWQKWWTENRGRIDELVKQANAAPPPAPGRLQMPPPQAVAIDEIASPSAAPTAIATATPSSVSAKPTSSVSPANSERRGPVWPWIVGGIVTVLVIVRLSRR